MGLTTIRVKIKNLWNKNDSYFEDELLVDSGAIYSIVPAEELQKLGIKPERVESFSVADGRIFKRKVGNAIYEYKGIHGAAPVLFGEEGDAKVLGVVTLEALGLMLDPFKRKVYKSRLSM